MRGAIHPGTAPAATDAGPAPSVLFYDGTCGLCRRSIGFIRRAGPREPLEFIDVNDDAAMSRFPQIDRLSALKHVTLLEPGGPQHHGYSAVTAVLRVLPGWRRAHFLLRLWPIQFLGHIGYHIVGHNRHRISRLFGWDQT